jgi:hypothetical protein
LAGREAARKSVEAQAQLAAALAEQVLQFRIGIMPTRPAVLAQAVPPAFAADAGGVTRHRQEERRRMVRRRP